MATKYLRASEFKTLNETEKLKFPSLQSVNIETLRLRLQILQIWNNRLRAALPLIDLGTKNASSEELGTKLRLLRGRIFVETKKQLLASAVMATRRKDLHKQLGLKLDRRLAMRSRPEKEDSKGRDVSLSSCLFAQALPTLASPKAPQYLRGIPGEQVMSIEYKGEIGVDAGGLFNETLTALADDELFASSGNVLNLFLRTPNAVQKNGKNLDSFVPNPSLKDPHSLNAFRAAGRLIALAVRSQQYVDENRGVTKGGPRLRDTERVISLSLSLSLPLPLSAPISFLT